MHKIAVGIAFLILISGCDRSDDAQNLPVTTSHKPIKPVIPTVVDRLPDGPESENLYTSTLQRDGIQFQDRTKTVSMGRTVCAALQTNAVLGVAADPRSLDYIFDRIMKGTDYTLDQTALIIGASIGAFCPEFSYLGN
ncbi:DUF732 domain-containing protein [Nocardia sp. NPDC101769]|uniref:DUF732 domain-containing protein n=1 Tax=Nocardia sp. NPDC101769 TaxID=3364333 RepID=UPI0038258916